MKKFLAVIGLLTFIATAVIAPGYQDSAEDAYPPPPVVAHDA